MPCIMQIAKLTIPFVSALLTNSEWNIKPISVTVGVVKIFQAYRKLTVFQVNNWHEFVCILFCVKLSSLPAFYNKQLISNT